MEAAERGCCDEVVPEVERLLEKKVEELDTKIAELSAFRERLRLRRRQGIRLWMPAAGRLLRLPRRRLPDNRYRMNQPERER